ncbi:MAG: hypothetical protein CM1200mP40_07480 [Gammaproteobacteria bacterium]|nr:MAG: hypothetical protein CM1200mP40_07480 [Gammaproteobacteria bacterium]
MAVPTPKQVIASIPMRIIIQKSLFALYLALCGSLVVAQEREAIVVAELGPQVGEQVPDFELKDQFGETHSLDSIMGPNGAMLLFHRSADW